MAHECHTASIFLIKPLQSSNFSCGTSLCKKANLKTRACLLNGISFFRENVCTNRNRSLIFPMSLHRGRFGLPLGILFKRLRSAKQGRDKGFQNFLHKADFWVQADNQRCLMSPPHLSFSLLPPPLIPLSASPITQQQWAHRSGGHPCSEGVSGTELPGVDSAFPPAGFTGLQL